MLIGLEEAIQRILNEDVVAIPTETVYGLSATIFSDSAIKKIFDLKNRPQDNPLIVHVQDFSQVESLVGELPPMTVELMSCFWPGPLTLLLPLAQKNSLSPLITAGLPTVAIRMPKTEKTRALIQAVGPLVAPSANRSGYPSSTHFLHVEADFGADFPILEADFELQGIESTILAYEKGKWVIAREGSLAQGSIQSVLGYPLDKATKRDQPICPGQHYRHYSPKARLLLKEFTDLEATFETVVGFSDRIYPNASRVLHLGRSDEPDQIQKNLYAVFRLLDQEGIPSAYVDCSLPDEEPFQLIKNRFIRAAL